MLFSNKICRGTITISDDMQNVTISGNMIAQIPSNEIQYVAARPIERRLSFTGSGLPYATTLQAFENTPTKGKIQVDATKQFKLTFPMPSAYYTGLGTAIVPPTIYLTFGTIKDRIYLSPPLPFRTLTYPNLRKDVMFYDGLNTLPVRGQEEILRSAGYCTHSHYDNWWGQKPPL